MLSNSTEIHTPTNHRLTYKQTHPALLNDQYCMYRHPALLNDQYCMYRSPGSICNGSNNPTNNNIDPADPFPGSILCHVQNTNNPNNPNTNHNTKLRL